jgi:cobalt-zinc-cadmium efflux system outer membrane protein
MQQAVITREESRRIPDLDVGAGVRRFSASDETAFVFEFSLPLPLFDRNQGALRAAHSRLAGMQAKRHAAFIASREELGKSYEELVASFEQAVAFRDQILPDAQEAAAMAQDAYLRGRFRFTDVLDTQRRLFELRGHYFTALANYHAAVARIERLIAMDLVTAASESDERRR